jgi:uncharacterized protein
VGLHFQRQGAPGRPVIQGYGEGGFRIAGLRHAGSVLILPEATIAWPVAGLADLTVASLAPVLAATPRVELLVLGCGASLERPPASLQAVLRAQGITLDAMATAAACRTFNILLAEDRRVAAALIAL